MGRAMAFKVVVADNFHYMDESESYEHGEYPSLELAVEAAKQIVDQYLASAYKPGTNATELYRDYVNFGEDPYIVAPAQQRASFSAWEYARERCDVICQQGTTAADNERSGG